MPELGETLTQFHIDYRESDHHHVRSGWIGVDCPKCSLGWHRYRLGFEIATGRTNCWFCGRLNGIEMLSLLCGISYKEAKSIWTGIDFQFVPTRKQHHDGTLKIPSGVASMLPAHENYLKKRGFDPSEISRLWEVKGIGPEPGKDLQWRIYIPIHNNFGEVVSWTTRSIRSRVSKRYISASTSQESVPHKSLLYGAHLARHAIVIVEGPISAWSIGPGAVATCGVGYSIDQMAEMAKYPVRIVCFDSEKGAQKRANVLCNGLKPFPGITERIQLESGGDPADADPLEIQELRKQYLELF